VPLWRPARIRQRASHPDGRRPGVYRLKKPWPDGRTHLVLSPVAFLRRLADILPPPGRHLVRYAGVFAPRAKRRARVVALAPAAVAEAALTAADRAIEPTSLAARAPSTPGRSTRLPWADLLQRVFAEDDWLARAADAAVSSASSPTRTSPARSSPPSAYPPPSRPSPPLARLPSPPSTTRRPGSRTTTGPATSATGPTMTRPTTSPTRQPGTSPIAPDRTRPRDLRERSADLRPPFPNRTTIVSHNPIGTRWKANGFGPRHTDRPVLSCLARHRTTRNRLCPSLPQGGDRPGERAKRRAPLLPVDPPDTRLGRLPSLERAAFRPPSRDRARRTSSSADCFANRPPAATALGRLLLAP
jgi:hypothetical protein